MDHHDLAAVQIHHFAGLSHREQTGTGFHAEHQGGQCKAGLSLLRYENGDEGPDEATARDTEEYTDKEQPEARGISAP